MQLSRCSGRQAGAFKPASSSRRGPAAAARPAQQQRRTAAVVRAALAPEAAAAVAQQGIAFAIVLAAEGAFSLSSVPEGDKGRPQIPLLAAGVGGTAAAVALVSAGGDSPLAGVGLFLGFATAAAMLVVNAQRVLNLEYTDNDWPGPKAWPAGMSLISFFELSVFWQAIFPLIFGKA